MAWDQGAMDTDTVLIVALAPGVLAVLFEAVLQTRGRDPLLAILGLLLVAYPYNAHWTVVHLVAATALGAGGLAFLWDVLFARAGRPGPDPKERRLDRSQDPPPRTLRPAHRG